jgi:aspartate-semialdehyde dehydrogenase
MVSINVGVLGATGLVGSRIVSLLANHPWFRVAAVSGGSRNQGRRYAEARRDGGAGLPDYIGNLKVAASDAAAFADCPLILSALPAEVASDVEPGFAAAGHAVVSNAKSDRLAPDVPLVVPEINPDHLALIDVQQRKRNWRGYIVTNPNCATIVLSLAIAPLYAAFGLRQLQVTTLQAISGAGYGGVDALSLIDNVVPFIAGEEDKVEIEPRKLLGTLDHGEVAFADVAISATCTRVPVLDGHLVSLSLQLGRLAQPDEILAVWREWQPLKERNLPSAPVHPVIYLTAPDRPQPRLDRDTEGGMAIVIGRLRPCPALDYKFVALGHNLVRGAAGGVILIAELLKSEGRLP